MLAGTARAGVLPLLEPRTSPIVQLPGHAQQVTLPLTGADRQFERKQRGSALTR